MNFQKYFKGWDVYLESIILVLIFLFSLLFIYLEEFFILNVIFLKKELDCMENVDIIEKVFLNQLVDWVSSFVCVDKLDGFFWVCLDLRGFNFCVIK